eukprot:TRINITY_DN9018_c0_g1_i4.p1 TRINITY_DN9018_c0_g1~~TRINITY_DN9018_c0_g1_i4.p1  ORF type:complete len:271 (+),score=48.83 TRINITY_DN9018_c0_g1_i4:52-864(+)
MAQKKAGADIKQKLGVKFQLSPPKVLESAQASRPVSQAVQHQSAEACRDLAVKVFNQSDKDFKLYIKNDGNLDRLDTVHGFLRILKNLKNVLRRLNEGSYDDKMKNYYLTYNGTIQIVDICQQFLRKNLYPILTRKYYSLCIASMECHLVLLGVKYLDWRVKLYVELAHAYEELGQLQFANKTIELAIGKVMEVKALEESDPPLQDYAQQIFFQNLRILKILEIKYKLQGGQSVSYTHLTLPTKRIVQILVVAVLLKKKTNKNTKRIIRR